MTATHHRLRLVAAFAALLAALGIGYWLGRSGESASTTGTSGVQPAERQVLYWYDPMVPDQHFDKPGKSPFMDMQMVPKYADEATADGVSVAPGVRQNLGMRTMVVKRGRLGATLRVPGTIAWDLRHERVVSARVDAIVEHLNVRAPFERVRAGQPLATIIARSWNVAIAEARALGGARSPAAQGLKSAAHERLRALGLPEGSGTGQSGRLTLTSPVTGVVSEIGVREGQAAPMGTLLFRINSTQTVWLEAAIPQAGLAGIANGTSVEATVDALPGETFRGRVENVLPQVDTNSRTQQARIVLDNPRGVLTPGMLAQVEMRPLAGTERPQIPTEALIGAGAQARVIVLAADDTFRAVHVQAGRSSEGVTEILAGLKGGERVVVSGQFLIDSEANLSGALERLDAADAEATNDGVEHKLPSDIMPGMPNMATQPSPPVAPKRQCPVLYWYDPMAPDKHFDKPGKSPFMDMQLVPKFAPEASADCTIRDVPAAERQS
jgi:Cu(I)/Ag(I) efflux system membrane fusion protein